MADDNTNQPTSGGDDYQPGDIVVLRSGRRQQLTEQGWQDLPAQPEAGTPQLEGGPVQRFALGLTSLPQNFGEYSPEQILNAINVPNVAKAGLNIVKGIVQPYRGYQQAVNTSWDRYKAGEHGLGILENALADVPWAGTGAVSALEQMRQGDVAGGFGSLVGNALQAKPSFSTATSAGLRGLQYVTGVGKEAVRQNMERQAAEIGKARERINLIQQHNQDVSNRLAAGKSSRYQHAPSVAQLLPHVADEAELQATQQFPDVTGTVDSSEILSDARNASKRLHGSFNLPPAMQGIVDQVSPVKMKTRRAPLTTQDVQFLQPYIDTKYVENLRQGGMDAKDIREHLISPEGGGVPRNLADYLLEHAGIGQGAIHEAGGVINNSRLQGWISELGRAVVSPALQEDQRAAVTEFREMLKRRQEDLHTTQDLKDQLSRARESYRDYIRTFRSRTSPLGRAQLVRDPDRSLRPELVHDLLTKQSAYETTQRLLAKYASTVPGAQQLSQLLRQMKESYDLGKKPGEVRPIPPEVQRTASQTPLTPPEMRRDILRRAPASGGGTFSMMGRYLLLRNALRALLSHPYLTRTLTQTPAPVLNWRNIPVLRYATPPPRPDENGGGQ